MPLRIKLRPDERVIINGALISAKQSTGLIIHNRVSLLRERQILPPHLANTPARRIYYSLQCAYVAEKEDQPAFIDLSRKYATEFGDVTMSMRMKGVIGRILELIETRDFYEAMRATQDVMRYEDFVLNQPSWEEANEQAGQ